ncbi:hypothetical protein P4O66_003957, partial [Electrophorus voltai]
MFLLAGGGHRGNEGDERGCIVGTKPLYVALRLLHDGHSTGSELGYLLPEQATGTAPPQHPLGYAQHSATAFPIHAEYHQARCRPISGPGTSHCLRAGSGTSAGAEADV